MKLTSAYLLFFLMALFCNCSDQGLGLDESEYIEIEKEPLIPSDDVNINGDTEIIDDDTASVQHTTDDPRPCFRFDLNYTKTNVWTAQAELTTNNQIFAPGIRGANISVNSQLLTEDTFFTGKYTGTFQSLTSGQTITVTLSFTDFNTQIFTASIPSDFTRSPNLTATRSGDAINFIWEAVACSSYQLFKKIENGQGTKIICNISANSAVTDTIYQTKVSSLFSGNITMSPDPCYFTFWVCPSNRISLSPAFSSESYIQLAGKASNGVTNKSKQ